MKAADFSVEGGRQRLAELWESLEVAGAGSLFKEKQMEKSGCVWVGKREVNWFV